MSREYSFEASERVPAPNLRPGQDFFSWSQAKGLAEELLKACDIAEALGLEAERAGFTSPKVTIYANNGQFFVAASARQNEAPVRVPEVTISPEVIEDDGWTEVYGEDGDLDYLIQNPGGTD